MYTIIFANSRVRKSLENLPGEIEARIVDSLKELELDPRPHGVIMLSGYVKGSWRLRIGDYRVMYDIDDAKRRVYITKIAHRREIYRM